MKKTLILLSTFISLAANSQILTLYAEKKNPDNSITQYFVKDILDSVFNQAGVYICPTVESFEGQYQPAFPQGFGDFIKCADGKYRNFIPFSQFALQVRWDSIVGKPTITTVGTNLIGLSTPASPSLIRVNADGTSLTRTAAQAKQDLSIDLVDNTSDATKNSASAYLSSKTIGAFNVGIDAGANDSYTVTLSPAPTSYTNGMIVIFRANTANTTACSINVNGLGVKSIVKRVSTTPATGDILALMWCMLIYDGTNFVILNPVVN